MSRATPLARLTTARPKATTAENTMPMAVSAERLLLRRTTMTASPTSTPKSGMDSRGFTARIRPRATPVKAECRWRRKEGHAEIDDLHAQHGCHGREQQQTQQGLLPMKRACRQSRGNRPISV